MSDILRAHTFSICAVDAASGQAGVAVASKCLSVGALVPYAEPGVGAIATQAMVNPRYGPRGLELLRKGVPAEEVVRRLTEEDFTPLAEDDRWRGIYEEEGLREEGADFLWQPTGPGRRCLFLTSRIRQLGVVDRMGRAASFTGARCLSWAGHRVGEGYCCQGNLLAGEAVLKAMAETFEAERARMFERARSATQPGERLSCNLVGPLLAALQAGEAAGGDRRGKQAAALLVVRDRGHWTGGDRWCDLRVDDHAEAVAELTRIVEKAGFAKA